MEQLIKSKWNIKDKEFFLNFISKFAKHGDSAKFEQKILKTNYKCIALQSKDLDKIVNYIYKGNYLSFIDLWIVDNYSSLAIIGKLIAKIKDFNIMKTYLLKYIKLVDCWAGCDCLKLKVKKCDRENYFNLSKYLIKSNMPFERRLGLIILFKLIDDDYVDNILNICNSFYNETHYYVNMANAWLLCDCFIKFRDKTLNLLQQKTLNKFTQNKTISKCRDSFRVSNQDKNILLSLKI